MMLPMLQGILNHVGKWGMGLLVLVLTIALVAQVREGLSSAEAEQNEVSEPTPLMLACSSGKADVVRDLLANGADPSVRDAAGFDAVACALYTFDDETATCLDALLAGGVDPNTRLGGRVPLLVAAVIADNEPAVKRLLDHGAYANAVGTNGRTALAEAIEGGNRRIERLLRQIVQQHPDHSHRLTAGY